MRLPRIAAVTIALAAFAGAARAETADDLKAAVRAGGPMVAARSEAPKARILLPEAYADAYGLKSRGLARTAIDGRFDPDDDVIGAVGFLCGLQPGARRSGAAAARGVDPTGRFLGAKLSLAFR
jgi:hypothetical protein